MTIICNLFSWDNYFLLFLECNASTHGWRYGISYQPKASCFWLGKFLVLPIRFGDILPWNTRVANELNSLSDTLAANLQVNNLSSELILD
jgi:hypothetical protein